MAHHDDASTYADLLARLGDEGTKELFRRLLEQALQDLIDAELTAAIGADRHQRSESRSNYRNGGRSRLLSTPAGDVELRIPKVRVGSFFPALLEPRRRVDKALWAVIMTAYITGTSTRKVDDLVRALGCDSGISAWRCTVAGSTRPSRPTAAFTAGTLIGARDGRKPSRAGSRATITPGTVAPAALPSQITTAWARSCSV